MGSCGSERNEQMKRENGFRIAAIVTILLFAGYWFWNPTWSADTAAQELLHMLISRAFGSLAFLFVLCYLSYRIWQKPHLHHLAVLLPALAVAVNNLPILALANGFAWIERYDLLPLFVLDSLMIGIFEELAFRGVLFPAMLERHRKSKKGILLTTAISSAVFGLVHLLNLLEGADIASTLLQVGYSFLIGGMCAIVLLKTGNLLWCILLHALYDFCGNLIPTIGAGALWDTPTVVITAILGVAVTAWMLVIFFRLTPDSIPNFYRQNTIQEEHEHN